MKPTMELAKEIAATIEGNPDWDVVRDIVDQKTAGDLDCTQLDLLTDWVTHECDKREGCDCDLPYNSQPGAERVSIGCPVHNKFPETHWEEEERHVMAAAEPRACSSVSETGGDDA